MKASRIAAVGLVAAAGTLDRVRTLPAARNAESRAASVRSEAEAKKLFRVAVIETQCGRITPASSCSRAAPRPTSASP